MRVTGCGHGAVLAAGRLRTVDVGTAATVEGLVVGVVVAVVLRAMTRTLTVLAESSLVDAQLHRATRVRAVATPRRGTNILGCPLSVRMDRPLRPV
jgi:hypothetical protein